MISLQEFARRLSTLGPATVTVEDVEDAADAAGVRIDPSAGIDASQAQQLLDRLSPAEPVSGNEIAAASWPPSQAARPAVAPVTFSSPGSVDAPADQPTRSHRSRQARTSRPGGSRRPRS